MTNQQITDVWCPQCGAVPGYGCVGTVEPHKARTDHAQSLQKAQDYVYALHLLDEATRNAKWDIALGDGRV